MTLRVHPLHGQTVEISRNHGPAAVWAETQDGRLTILPMAWLDTVRRVTPDCEPGAAKLAIEALAQLARWVEARKEAMSSQDCREVGHAPGAGPTRDHGGDLSASWPEADGGRERRTGAPTAAGRDCAAAAVVEQAGARGSHRAAERRRGGKP